MQQKIISLEVACAALPELWSPRVPGPVDNRYLRVAKVEGDFPWHTHDAEKETVLVLRRRPRIGRSLERGGPLYASPAEFFILPAGIPHNSRAAVETWLALIHTTTTLHTGLQNLPPTRSVAEQLR